MVICLERGADLHMAQLMPLPLTVSCFSKIQIGFTFLVPAHPGSPGKRAVKWVCVFCATESQGNGCVVFSVRCHCSWWIQLNQLILPGWDQCFSVCFDTVEWLCVLVFSVIGVLFCVLTYFLHASQHLDVSFLDFCCALLPVLWQCYLVDWNGLQ